MAACFGEEKPVERDADSAWHAKWWRGTSRVGYAVSIVLDADETLRDSDVPTVTSFIAVYDGHGDELLGDKMAQVELTRCGGKGYCKQSSRASFLNCFYVKQLYHGLVDEGSTVCVPLITDDHIIDYVVSAMQEYRSTMKDSHSTLEDLNVSTATSFIFSVYDGHGGSAVVQYCSNHFHVELLNHLVFSCNLHNVVTTYFSCRMDELLREKIAKLELTGYSGKDYYRQICSACFLNCFYVKQFYVEPIDEGSSACVDLIRDNQIIISNSGDSFCVLSRNCQRIRHSGYCIWPSRGACCIDDGIIVSTVNRDMRFKKKKSRQALSCSLAICSENISDDTEFLVIAYDSIWDVLQNQEVVHHINEVALKDEQLCDRKRTLAKKVVSSSDGASNLGISTEHTRKAVNPPLRVLNTCQIWVFLLFILSLANPVLPSKDVETNEIGSCHFDKTSVAMLSCIQTNGKYWNPPSASCCNALLYAIDTMPISNESGACCLCRYIKRKNVIELATSYVLCQGKDGHIVTKWSFPIRTCVRACPRKSGKVTIAAATTTRYAEEDRPLVDEPGRDSEGNIFLWRVLTFGCVAIFVFFGLYLCLIKLVAKVKSLRRNPQHQGLPPPDSDRVEPRRSSRERRRRSGQHRMSSGSAS